ncbi:MAG: hypothetical protein QF464_16210, partial [Myxococcota bacterium]|nr:hypothetical protein [Myxococcota bacterium]
MVLSVLVACAQPATIGDQDNGWTPSPTTDDVLDGDGETATSGSDLETTPDPQGQCLSNADCTGQLGTLPPCIIASCDGETGTCVEAPAPGGTHCDDQDVCTQGDVCLAGECLSGAPTNCEDTNVCTDNLCDPVSGCQYPFTEALCDDGDACSIDKCVDNKCAATIDANCCKSAADCGDG